MKPCDETSPSQPQPLVATASQDAVQELLELLQQQNMPPETALASLAVAMSQLMSTTGCHQFVLSSPLSQLVVLLQTGAPAHSQMIH
ncbi:hypothetical protein ACFSFZ_10175 [Mixta tenebrionis]|uniref:Uncharacterized protein n=1 Tax=Mixta tenebrionis TaxID=2562439 RepID=A0A506VB46_9GAMM|nr:hypothetical protein [Mixta tenebrionis]TPW42649.1 hypothetical protein FKM52_07650 [Mixta tenebrionis]